MESTGSNPYRATVIPPPQHVPFFPLTIAVQDLRTLSIKRKLKRAFVGRISIRAFFDALDNERICLNLIPGRILLCRPKDIDHDRREAHASTNTA